MTYFKSIFISFSIFSILISISFAISASRIKEPQAESQPTKVFGIGWKKTGTTSLQTMWLQMKLPGTLFGQAKLPKGKSSPRKELINYVTKREYSKTDDIIQNYDLYSDIPFYLGDF